MGKCTTNLQFRHLTEADTDPNYDGVLVTDLTSLRHCSLLLNVRHPVCHQHDDILDDIAKENCSEFVTSVKVT